MAGLNQCLPTSGIFAQSPGGSLTSLCSKNNARNISYMPVLIFLHSLTLNEVSPHYRTDTNYTCSMPATTGATTPQIEVLTTPSYTEDKFLGAVLFPDLRKNNLSHCKASRFIPSIRHLDQSVACQLFIIAAGCPPRHSRRLLNGNPKSPGSDPFVRYPLLNMWTEWILEKSAPLMGHAHPYSLSLQIVVWWAWPAKDYWSPIRSIGENVLQRERLPGLTSEYRQ